MEDTKFLEAMLHHHIDPSILLMKGMEALVKAAEEPLYNESKCYTKEFTMLRSVLKLLVLKARYGMSDAGFDAFLSIITDMFLKENKVLANTYYAKKLISPLTKGVEKIHVYRNHCILYRGDFYKDLKSCPKYGASRYRRIKTIKRKSVLPPCLKKRSERRPNKTTNRVLNLLSKKKTK